MTPAEEAAEQLMRQAQIAWNVHGQKELAERMQRKALEAVQGGEARPEVVAEVRGG